MSLRERKARRTRAEIVAAGTALFMAQGYDATTMGQIAERAEVGKSTLYRYFPTKEDVLLGPFTARIGSVADLVRSRPWDEPLAVVLGHVVRSYVAVGDADSRALRAVIDAHPAARAKVWDLVAREQSSLEVALAERLGRDEPDLEVLVSARIATALAVIAVEGPGADQGSPADRIERMVRDLDPSRVVFPALPDAD